MLDGGAGPARRKAMELIVRYARIVGAERLCRVTWADLFCGAHRYLEVVDSHNFDDVFSRMSLCSSETVELDTMARAESGALDLWERAKQQARQVLKSHRPNYLSVGADRQIRDRFDIKLDVPTG